MTSRYFTVDVFTDTPFNGAQVAVLLDADQLSDAERLCLAREINLSDTVFVNASDNGFALANYSPKGQQGFGAHSVIAAAKALVAAEKIALPTEGTAVDFTINGSKLAVAIEPTESGIFTRMSLTSEPIVDNFTPSSEELADMLSLTPSDLDCKPFYPKLVSNQGVFLVVPVRSFTAIRAARFKLEAWQASQAPSTMAERLLLVSESTEHSSSDFHLRLMGAQIDESDDPPVGSSIPALAAYLCAHQHLALGTYSFTVERGISNARQSILAVEMDHKGTDKLTIRIGGNGILMSQGEFLNKP